MKIASSFSSDFGFFTRVISGRVKAAEKGNRDAARFLMDRCHENVSTPYPPASTPGEFPRLRTGRGRESIQVARIPEGSGQPASYEVFVAPPFLHMAYLEMGTAISFAGNPIIRQWLEPTYDMHRAEIEALQVAYL